MRRDAAVQAVGTRIVGLLSWLDGSTQPAVFIPAARPDPACLPPLLFCPSAGAAAAQAPNATAYVHRTVGFDVVTDTFFMSSPGAAEAAQAWLDDLYGKR